MARPTDALRADYYGWAEGVQAEIDALARIDKEAHDG